MCGKEPSLSRMVAALMMAGVVSCDREKVESAMLTATIEATPQTVNTEQAVRVTLRVTNPGPSTVSLTFVAPSATLAGSNDTGSATCTAFSPALPQPIDVTTTVELTWTCTSSSAGVLTLTATGRGTDVRTHELVSATPEVAATATVQTPAGLQATLAIQGAPAVITDGDVLSLISTVTNRGTSGAHLISVTPTATSGSCTAVTTPLPAAIPGLGSIDLTWTCQVEGESTLTLRADIGATDDNSSKNLSTVAGPLDVAVEPKLVATLYTPRTRVNVMQPIDWAYTLHNNSEDIACLSHFYCNCGMMTGLHFGPIPLPISPGGDFTYNWQGALNCSMTSPGAWNLGALAEGVWDTTHPVPGDECVYIEGAEAFRVDEPIPMLIDTPVQIVGVGLAAEPTTVDVGQPATVILTIANSGTAPARLSATPTTSPAGPDCGPAFEQSFGGGTYVFRWSCTASAPGTYSYGALLEVYDLNDPQYYWFPDPGAAAVVVH